MKEVLYAIPDYTTAKEIKRVRQTLHLTQKDFAKLLNVSKPTVERWEQSDKPIAGAIVPLIKMLQRYPEYVSKVKIPDKTMPIRLYYMHDQDICTVIDVNEVQREIEVTYYTDNLMFRAFGVNENPDYEAYLEFLESRCFPESRDKMKLILRDLDLPFYDPFMIIEKTEGRMAEDDFWIRIVR